MSASWSLHVGPFCKCTNIFVSGTTKGKGCPKCDTHPDDVDYATKKKFCATCGSELIEIVKITSGPRHLEPMSDDALCPIYENFANIVDNPAFTGFHIYLPNYKFMDRETRLGGDYGVVYHAFTGDAVQKEVELFKEKFQKQIQELRDIYGADNVTVEWGYVSDFC